MREKKRILAWEIISMTGFLCMSVSFLIMPHIDSLNGLDTLGLVTGLMFWIGLVVGLMTQLVIAILSRGKEKTQKLGIISCCKNQYGKIIDSICLISLVLLIAGLIITNQKGYICYIGLSLFSFSFCMHCILNGRAFNRILQK